MHLVRRRESRCDLRRRDLPNVHPTGGWVRPIPVAVGVAVGPEALATRRCRDHTKSDGNEQNQKSRIRYTHRVLLWDHWLQKTINILDEVPAVPNNKAWIAFDAVFDSGLSVCPPALRPMTNIWILQQIARLSIYEKTNRGQACDFAILR